MERTEAKKIEKENGKGKYKVFAKEGMTVKRPTP